MKKIQIIKSLFFTRKSFSWKTWDFGESSPQSTALVWSFWSAASTSASVSLEISRFQNCNHCENVVEKNRLQKTKEKQKCILYAFHYIPIYIWDMYDMCSSSRISMNLTLRISTPLTSPLGVLTRQVLSVLRVGCQAQRTARTARTGHTTTPRPFIKKNKTRREPENLFRSRRNLLCPQNSARHLFSARNFLSDKAIHFCCIAMTATTQNELFSEAKSQGLAIFHTPWKKYSNTM